VTGGRGKGEELTQLDRPLGVWVDDIGTVYVAEGNNRRVTRWPRGETSEVVVVGGVGEGDVTNQFHDPEALSFDRRGNMYVAEWRYHCVQQFKLEQNRSTRLHCSVLLFPFEEE
jgi:sugar lactone lactonase YvrE